MLTHTDNAQTSSNESQSSIKCDQCDFKAENVTMILSHILKHHEQRFETCQFCGYVATSRDILNSHMLEKHDDQELLTVISNQISRVTESFDLFEVFKREMKDVINNMIGGHNSVMQELSVIRNNQVNENRFKGIECSIQKLSTLLNERSSTSAGTSSACAPPPPPTSPTERKSDPSPRVPMPNAVPPAKNIQTPRQSKPTLHADMI